MMSEFNSALLDELARCEVSVVFLDLGKPGPHLSNLTVNYQDGIEQAVAHLVQLGHTRIAYVGGPTELRSARRRETGVHPQLQEVSRQGSRALEPLRRGFPIEGGRKAGAALIADPRRYTAVMVANDMMALGVIRAARAAKISIPEELSIVGFDDIALAALAEPPLTTVSIPREVLGRKALDALLATINHPERQGVEIAIPTSLVIRESTGPASVSAASRGLRYRDDMALKLTMAGRRAAPTRSCRSSRARAPAHTSRRRRTHRPPDWRSPLSTPSRCVPRTASCYSSSPLALMLTVRLSSSPPHRSSTTPFDA